MCEEIESNQDDQWNTGIQHKVAKINVGPEPASKRIESCFNLRNEFSMRSNFVPFKLNALISRIP